MSDIGQTTIPASADTDVPIPEPKPAPAPAGKPQQNIAGLIAGHRHAELEYPIPTRGDLVAEYARKNRMVQIARATGGTSLAGPDLPEGIEEEIEALAEQIRETTIMITLKAMPKRKYRTLKMAHPPRRDPDGTVMTEDRKIGVDPTTFFPALIPICAADAPITADQWETLLEEVLADGDYEQLCTEVWNLNEEPSRAPLSQAVFTKTPRSASV